MGWTTIIHPLTVVVVNMLLFILQKQNSSDRERENVSTDWPDPMDEGCEETGDGWQMSCQMLTEDPLADETALGVDGGEVRHN